MVEPECRREFGEQMEEKLNIGALIEAQRRLSISSNPFERVVGSLCIAGILKERLTALHDCEVGQLMFDFVWDHMNLLGPELVLCQVATERLLRSSPLDISETEDSQ